MNKKQYVGKRVSSLEEYDNVGPITGIALVIDDNNEYLAGDQNGYVLEVECPYGTQAMANNMLASLKGQIYKGYRAENAIMEPQAELGDGVTIAGNYSMLAYRSVEFGPGHMSEIAAPGENELNHEYPYISSTQREINRKIAQTRSSIAKTAEEIRLEIDGVDGRVSSLAVTLDGVTITDESGKTRIKGSSIETGSIAAGSIRADQIQLTGAITWSDLSSSLKSEISSASDIAESLANGTYYGGTFINGNSIYSPNIYSNNFTVYPDQSNPYGSGTFNLYGNYYGSIQNAFQISYNINYSVSSLAYVNFDSPFRAWSNWNFPHTNFNNNVEFKGTNTYFNSRYSGSMVEFSCQNVFFGYDTATYFNGPVYGVSTLSLSPAESTKVRVASSTSQEGPGVEVEAANPDQPVVNLSDDNGVLKIELPNATWYLDETGLHQ